MKSKKRFKVTERDILIDEIIKAADENRIYEAFSAGTAVTVGPIEKIGYKDRDYLIPIDEKL